MLLWAKRFSIEQVFVSTPANQTRLKGVSELRSGEVRLLTGYLLRIAACPGSDSVPI